MKNSNESGCPLPLWLPLDAGGTFSSTANPPPRRLGGYITRFSPNEFLGRNAGVVAAEAEGVVHDGIDLHLARGVGHVIQIALRIGHLVD